MKTSLCTPDMIAAFTARGGAVTRLAITDTSAITNEEWKSLVRADVVEVEPLIQSFYASRGFVKLDGKPRKGASL